MTRREMLDEWLEGRLRLRPGELGPTVLLLAGCFCAVGAFVATRSARDALFLARFATRGIPGLYVASSVAVALVGMAFSRLTGRARPEELGPALGVLLAASFAAFRLLVPYGSTWVFRALWVWVEVAGALTVIQFWSVANDVHDARTARRTFVWIAAGGTLADVAVGLSVARLAPRVGTDNLLWLGAALFLAAGALPAAASARVRPTLVRTRRGGHRAIHGAGLLGSPYLRAIAGLSVVAFVAITFVDYQFKAAAAARFGGDTVEMASFFGSFHALAGMTGLLVQLAFTAHVLDRLGVAASLSVLPLALGGTSLLAALSPGLLTASLAKGADHAVRFSVTESASQLLFLPLAPGRRQEAKAFIDGAVRPATVALAGVVLAVWGPPSPGSVALAAAALAAIWLASLARLEPEYLRSLRQGLPSPPLAPGPLSAGEQEALRGALAEGDPAAAEAALDLASAHRAAVGAEAAALLASASPRLRARACAYLARTAERRFAMAVLERIDDADGEVRISAARSFCALARGDELRAVEPLLSHPDPGVRADAAAALVRGGEDVAARSGRATLEALATSDELAEREHAARAIALSTSPDLRPLLADMLDDPSAVVRRAAVRAAAELRAPEFVPALVRGLADRHIRDAASEALGAYGPGIEGPLRDVLSDPLAPPAVRRGIPRALGRLATPAAATALVEHLDEPDAKLRKAVDRALGAVVRGHPELPLDVGRLRRACLVELEKGYRALAAAEALGLDPVPHRRTPRGLEAASVALALALAERAASAGRRAAGLVALIHPEADLAPVLLALDDGTPAHRAGALEILDHVLEPRLRRLLVPLLDGRSRSARLREVSGILRLPRRTHDAWLPALAADEDDWIAAATLHHAAAAGIQLPAAALASLLEHPTAFVREAALTAAVRLFPPTAREVACRQTAADPHPAVRALSRRASGQPTEGAP
ncbi:MAG TPA: HEAT repeat domain-containing protein [Anaeromyxobacteraceae bacterium]|nr:HEAT repeat domain-containing protein [Anaeromyxobacteraceae bacterium]